MKLDAWKHAFFSERMPACALKGHWVSFRLVDMAGNGKAYGGLSFSVHDSSGRQYVGKLNGEGFASLQEDRKSTRLNSSHLKLSRMPSSA